MKKLMKIKSEDKFLFCKNMKDDYCKIVKHKITNGFASRSHCGLCKYFTTRDSTEKQQQNIYDKIATIIFAICLFVGIGYLTYYLVG